MNKITHTRKEKTVTKLAQPKRLDKDGNLLAEATKQEFIPFQTVNKAKKYMRSLPQHLTGERRK